MVITEHLCPERPTDADLNSCCAEINVTLPDDYRAFLKSENGGRPEPSTFSFTTRQGAVDEDTVHYFFGLHEGRVGNLKSKRDNFRGRVPEDYLPIATDPFGNLILLKVATPNLGRVYFWDHEQEEDFPTLRNMSLIAGSFSEFVAALAE